jgi:hypothetical protein
MSDFRDTVGAPVVGLNVVTPGILDMEKPPKTSAFG